MSRKLFITTAAVLLASVGATMHSPRALADGGSSIEVTVTNITRGQIISPVVVATHSMRLSPLFELGSPASDALAAVAEDADLGPLVAALSSDPNVRDVGILAGPGGPIPPGESASLVLAAQGKFRYVSMVAMLVTTNDAFFALRGVYAPNFKQASYHSPAYDAGSEANNEDCDFIPGPPCGHPMVRDPDGAEGFVHIHAGIHGIGDLDPSMHDWRNPVAEITIRRVRDHDD